MRAVPIALITLLAAGPAGAVPALELTGGFGGDRPFASRAAASGGATAYFNPALLATDALVFELGLAALGRAVDLDLDARPAGYDVPGAVRDARRITPEGSARLERRPLPTAELRAERGGADPAGTDLFVSLGGALPLWPDRLSLGFTAVLPLSAFQSQNPHYVDERAQYFDNSLHVERHGDRLRLTTFTTALALRIVDAVSVGAGVTLLNDARTTASVYVPDAGDPERATTATAVDVAAVFAPHVGLAVRPLDGLTLGATVHLPSESRVEGSAELQFFDYEYPEGQDALFQRFTYVYAHEPLRVGAGVAGEVALGGWRLDGWLDGTWSRWSAYRDRQGATPTDWSDTVDVRGGVRAEAEADALSLGLWYAPSPVPEQSGRTNYVDNSRLGLGLGWRHRWTVEGRRLSAGLALAGQRLLARSHQKRSDAPDPVVDELPDAIEVSTGAPLVGSAGLQTNNPGFPGFSHGGWLWTAMLSVGVGL